MRAIARPRRLLQAVVFAATLEVSARLDDFIREGAPLTEPYSAERLYESDSLGKRGRPRASYRKWNLNSLGYRGPELRPGSRRVITIGASETFGLYETSEYPRLLEQELRRRAGGDAFEVVNVAWPGMSLAAALRRLPETIRLVDPRAAVIYPSAAAYIWLPWLDAPAAPDDAPRFELRLADQVRTLSKQATPAAVLDYLRRREVAREAQRYGAVLDRVPEENVARFRRDLEQLVDALGARGVQCVLATHATRFNRTALTDDDRYWLTAWRRFYPMLAEDGFLDMERRMNAAIVAVARARGLALVDAAAIPAGSRYFADFSHFTDDGAARMAELLADVLTIG